jgi:AcrR family transcriptional regulator
MKPKTGAVLGKRAPRRPQPRTTLALTTTEWAEAALFELGRVGLEGLAVEPLARRLGVTKGSFYWHFKDRRALLIAALERWEQLGTDAVIASLASEPDPRARLRALLQVAMGDKLHIEVAILAGSEDPIARPIVRRVVTRRLDYLIELYAQIGLPPAQARTFGLHALSAYLGVQHLIRTVPRELSAQTRAEYTAHLVATLAP